MLYAHAVHPVIKLCKGNLDASMARHCLAAACGKIPCAAEGFLRQLLLELEHSTGLRSSRASCRQKGPVLRLNS